ncbi:MAG: Rieske 2Fe-2S domain-containing protein [Desulfatitalea sp.]|nr:Rieske 2Fe-2S domain-containing protein [Desulfatitalea sp.]
MKKEGPVEFLKRIFGICETKSPLDKNCWRYADGKVQVQLSGARELDEKGAAIRLEGGGLPTRLLVIHGTDGEYHAFANKCTHFGRRLDPMPGQPLVRCCSVNKSTFQYDGSKVTGPAKNAIQSYPVEKREGALLITVGH